MLIILDFRDLQEGVQKKMAGSPRRASRPLRNEITGLPSPVCKGGKI